MFYFTNTLEEATKLCSHRYKLDCIFIVND